MTSALIGASRVEQIKDAVKAVENTTFSAAELKAIEEKSGDGGVNIWRRSNES
jgi:L-glyceraldehyde 3-phosphate reductase